MCDRVAVLPTLDARRPCELARLLVERDERPVQLAEVDLPFADRDAAAEPAAADGADRLVQVAGVLPDDLSGVHAHGEDVVLAGRDVDDAVVDDRLRPG